MLSKILYTICFNDYGKDTRIVHKIIIVRIYEYIHVLYIFCLKYTVVQYELS